MTSLKDLQLLIEKVARERPPQVWVPGLDDTRRQGRKYRKLAAYAFPAFEELGYVPHRGYQDNPGHRLFRPRDERDGEVHVTFDLAPATETPLGRITPGEPIFNGYIVGSSSNPRYLLEPTFSDDQTLWDTDFGAMARASTLVIDPLSGVGLLIFLADPKNHNFKIESPDGFNQELRYWFTTSDTWFTGPSATPPGTAPPEFRMSERPLEYVLHVAPLISNALVAPADRNSHKFDGAFDRAIAAIAAIRPQSLMGLANPENRDPYSQERLLDDASQADHETEVMRLDAEEQDAGNPYPDESDR